MKRLNPGDRVKVLKDHDYLGVSKRHIGRVISVYGDAKDILQSVEVRFNARPRTIIFNHSELRKV